MTKGRLLPWYLEHRATSKPGSANVLSYLITFMASGSMRKDIGRWPQSSPSICTGTRAPGEAGLGDDESVVRVGRKVAVVGFADGGVVQVVPVELPRRTRDLDSTG